MAAQTKKVRSVEAYLTLLKKARRTDNTIACIRQVLKNFAQFINVDLTDIHHHLTVENLLAYSEYSGFQKLSSHTQKDYLSHISRYMRLNGVDFDELELAALRPKLDHTRHDKPLDEETARKMLDLADAQMRAWITFLISTGCRSGESAQILLSDVDGDRVVIRNEIAKGGHGGVCWLHAEAREYLDLWLRDRPRYIVAADAKVRACHKIRPQNDQRLFACGADTLMERFKHLYDLVDGERNAMDGGTRRKISPHSCRKYFRTHAAKEFGIDLCDKLMRHTGAYLSDAYVRIPEEEIRTAFHRGEHVLYITRPHHRFTQNVIETLKRENAQLSEQIKAIPELERRLQLVELAQKRKG